MIQKLSRVVESVIMEGMKIISEADVLRDGMLLAVAMVVSGALNYGYQVYAGRALGPAAYGLFGAVFALQYLLHILGRAARLTSTRFIARLNSSNQVGYALLSRRMILSGVGVGIIIFLTVFLLTEPLREFLRISDRRVLWVVAAYAIVGIAYDAGQGVLQGREKFVSVGAYQIGNAGVKFLGAVVFIAAGFGVFGAIGAVAVGAGLMLSLMLALSLPIASPQRQAEPLADGGHRTSLRMMSKYSIPALLTGFCLTIPTTVDVIIVKHLFTATQAGVFTAVTVFAKAMIFVPLGIMRAVFPKFSAEHSPDREKLHSLLNRALTYTAVVTTGAAMVYFTVPNILLTMIFGVEYATGVALLRWYTLATAAFVMAIVPLHFELARQNLAYVYVFAAATAVEIGLMWVFSGTVIQIAQVILGVNIILFFIGLMKTKFHIFQTPNI